MGQTRDLYLIGFWYILKNLFPDGYGTESIRNLAKYLDIDLGHLHRMIKQADSMGLIHAIPGKSGTYFEILNPEVLSKTQHDEHEEEEVFNKLLPRFSDPSFLEELEKKDKISAVFWGALSGKKQPEEISRSAIIFLSKLDKSPAYIAAFVEKYLPRATTSPSAFFKAILEKEGDPLSKAEVSKGQYLLEQAKTLSQANPEALGLDAMHKLGKSFNVYMGSSIEECQQILSGLERRHEDFKK
jgi:hypothetical protein